MKKLLLSTLMLFMSYTNSIMAIDIPIGWMISQNLIYPAGWVGSKPAPYMLGGVCGVCFSIMSTAIGGIAGFGTAAVMNNTVYSGCQNQGACDKAKLGGYAGAALATVATVATVAMVGANAMGLATIGATVGGSLAVGATMLIAAPIVAAVAVGGATYWWFTY